MLCTFPILNCYSSTFLPCARKVNWWTNLTLKPFLNTTDWRLIYMSLKGAIQSISVTWQSGPFCKASAATVKLYRPPTKPTPANAMDKNICGDKTIRRGCKGGVFHTPGQISSLRQTKILSFYFNIPQLFVLFFSYWWQKNSDLPLNLYRSSCQATVMQ